MEAINKKAIIFYDVYPSGQKTWTKDGQYHRKDGWAIAYGNESETYGYFENGKPIKVVTRYTTKFFSEEEDRFIEKAFEADKKERDGKAKEVKCGGTETETGSGNEGSSC